MFTFIQREAIFTVLVVNQVIILEINSVDVHNHSADSTPRYFQSPEHELQLRNQVRKQLRKSYVTGLYTVT